MREDLGNKITRLGFLFLPRGKHIFREEKMRGTFISGNNDINKK